MSSTTVAEQLQADESIVGTGRFRILPMPIQIIVLILITIGLVSFLMFTFSWGIGDWILETTPYYYLLYGCFCPCAFLMMAARKKDRNRIPWYDYLLAASVLAIFAYFIYRSDSINRIGWVPPRDNIGLALACLISLISFEGGRRLGGLPLIIVCAVFAVYPLFAMYLPGYLYGVSHSWQYIAGAFAYGLNGLIGLPAQTTGNLLIGYLIFSGVLVGCGAGDFFIKLSLALLGRFRGGPAKVCVVASALFGTLTGSAVAEVATVGTVTIRTMKQIGYPAHYAGGIEAVAANGGAIMPPVMGAIAFIMAIITGIPYPDIVVAATLPAIFYYYGLLIQVDAYAVKANLKGLPSSEVPSAKAAVKQGWPFIFGIVFLVVGLLYFQWDVKSAIYAAVLLLIASFANRATMMTPGKLKDVIATTGFQIVQVMSVLMPVSFLILGFELTGSLTRLTSAIVGVAASNVWYVLVIAVIISFLFGMIGISFISYIILAVVAIPAVVQATGMSVMGLHFFMIWWLLVGAINPPVAVLAFIAAAVAGAPPMKTAWTATRLAAVTYFVPFFFVFEPALLFEGPFLMTAYSFLMCMVGITILGYGLEGYFLKVGHLPIWSRVLCVAGGFLVAMPEWRTTLAGAVISAITIVTVYWRNRQTRTSAIAR